MKTITISILTIALSLTACKKDDGKKNNLSTSESEKVATIVENKKDFTEKLIQDQDLHSFLMSLTGTMSKGNIDEYKKAVLFDENGKPLVNGYRLLEKQSEKSQKDLAHFYNEFEEKKYEFNNKSLDDIEDKAELEKLLGKERYKNVEEITQVTFNNGNAFLALLKYSGKWYFISGF